MRQLNSTKFSELIDYYTSNLVSFWKEHSSITIYIDCDEVLYAKNDFEVELTNIIIETLIEAQSLGANIIFTTNKEDSKFDGVIYSCESFGLTPNYVHVTDTPLEDYYKDKDRCIVVLDKIGAISSVKILQRAIILYKKYKINKND